MLAVRARADASDSSQGPQGNSNDEPLYLPATASTYCPFSAELLLATTRLGHLERYRQEVQQLYEPGMPVDLTRVALLISNIYQPQLDHRPYFEALEHLVAAAALAVMRKVSALAPASADSTDSSCSGFAGLDLQDPQQVLCAVLGINQVLFEEEHLRVNTADPYDPLNGSLADLLDTCKGNQWTLAVVYLHILDGLGLPCAVVGSSERIFVRVGEPPALLLTDADNNSNSNSSSSSSSSSLPATFLVDLCEPGVVWAYPPAVAPHSTLQTAHSLASSNGSCVSSSSSSGAVTDEWNKALHTFLQQHQQQGGEAASDVGADTGSPLHDAGTTADENPDTTHSSSSSSGGGGGVGSIRAGEFAPESAEDDSSAWQELQLYAAQDAATRNSWKVLYGPGALTEWGGSVSSSSSGWGGGSSSSGSSAASWGESVGGQEVPGGGVDGAATIGGMWVGEWLGVLDSPFAAAAAQPLTEGTQAAEADRTAAAAGGVMEEESMSSMDTSCGSATGSIELDGCDNNMAANSSGSGSSSGSVCGRGGAVVQQLCWSDVAAVGGLQPVSKRMLLQQMLGGMKLSLMMSGRQEELLMVLRYLRATDPFSLPDLRDAALCLAEQQPEEAAPLLREYLAVAPGAADADMLAEVLAQVQLRVQLGRAQGWQ